MIARKWIKTMLSAAIVCATSASVIVQSASGPRHASGGGGSAGEVRKVKVVATIFPYADWAERIGGNHVEVTCLLPPGASPHTFELTTKHARVIQHAQLLIYNGTGLDDWVGRLVEASANKNLVRLALGEQFPLAPIPVSLGSAVGDADGGGGHAHHEHGHNTASGGMWLDPMRAVRMVDLIAEALGRMDRAHSDHYRLRARHYWTQLDRLDRMYRRRLAGVKGGFIMFHEVFVYLFRRYGVQVHGVVEPYPGKEPSVEYIRKLTADVAGKSVAGVLSEPQLSEKAAGVLAEQIGTRLIRVDPIGGKNVPKRDSYVALMNYNLEQLTGGSKKANR